jgi:hypothetical protein
MARLHPDGIFGTKTDAMVREFQRLNRIEVDGAVGPITRLHLFPYIQIAPTIGGIGGYTGDDIVAGQQALRQPGSALTVGDPPKTDEPEEPQGFQFQLSLSGGIGAETRPRPLRQPWPPRFGPAKQTITVGAVLLRSGRLEISGELEASKPLKRAPGPQRAEPWAWDGSLKATYKAVSPIGPVTPFSPFIQVAPLAPLPGVIGVGAELEIFENILKLTVDGQVGFGYDFDRGVVTCGSAVSGGLEFNLDIFFQKHPPSKP